ncbi:MAG: lipid A-modifier LpxR family protein [Pseudomonadota bacterium]
MFKRTLITAAVLCAVLPAYAEEQEITDTFTWISETEDILAEGMIWNDRLGDGQDRYKTGGMTQSWLLPQSIFSDENWIDGHAAAIEFQGRGFIATPNNTSNPAAGDRPFAQYVGVGAYLRTFGESEPLSMDTSLSVENRAGVEIGLVGEPLPLFELQEALHGNGIGRTDANTLDTEVLVNAEVRRTYRFHMDLEATEVEFAPYAQGSFGMRENSVRVGIDLITGSSLKARTWNHEPAIGAMIAGGSAPRDGFQWATWVGGDVGYVAQDAFLDGGFDGSGPSTPREEVTARIRAGVMMEYDNFAMSYSVVWLSPEFEAQPEGQLVGGFQIKYRF